MDQRSLALAYVATEAKDWAAAERYCKLAMSNGEPTALQLLAVVNYKQARFQPAIDLLEEAQRAGEISTDGAARLIRLHLLAGDPRRGWELLRDCCRFNVFGPPLYPQTPHWCGEPLAGKTIAIWGGGYGDEILFARYIPCLSAAGAKVYLNFRPALLPLFRRLCGVHEALPFHVEAPDLDFHANTAELPYYFGAPEGNLWPANAAYLTVEPIELPGGGLRVGLVWAADSRHLEADDRTVSLADMAPLALSGIRLYSLQVGRFVAQMSPPPVGMIIENLSPGYPDFAEQASQMMGLDLVITVDTAVANLAGALGVPFWVAVPFVPDWRWGEHGDTTAWYPSARVYRQPVPGDWRSVFRNMAADLLKLASTVSHQGGHALPRHAPLNDGA